MNIEINRDNFTFFLENLYISIEIICDFIFYSVVLNVYILYIDKCRIYFYLKFNHLLLA